MIATIKTVSIAPRRPQHGYETAFWSRMLLMARARDRMRTQAAFDDDDDDDDESNDDDEDDNDDDDDDDDDDDGELSPNGERGPNGPLEPQRRMMTTTTTKSERARSR